MDQNQNDGLIRSAVLGKQIESFLSSDVGRYLQSRATRVYNAAIKEFSACDAADVATIRRIQADMWKAEAFMGWLGAGVQEGLTALGIIEGDSDGGQSDE